jgi:hypothetical protein
MLSIPEIIELLSGSTYEKAYLKDYRIRHWREVYYGMSLHISGIRPNYQYLRWDGGDSYSRVWYYDFNSPFYDWEYQFIFDTQLFSRHPREPEVTRQWRLSQYKPFTKAPFKQIIQVTTGALFQDSGYSVTIDDQQDNDYIWGGNFNGKTLVKYVEDKLQVICEDPNGLFLVVPRQSRNEAQGDKVEPEVRFIPSKYVRHVTDDEIIWCEDDVHWVVNRVGYFRFKNVESKWINIDGNDGYFGHGLGHIPAYVAGGNWNARGYFDSWLDAAKAIADEFVSAMSAKQIVDKEVSHPFIVEPDTECPDCDQASGYKQWCSGCNSATLSCSCDSPTAESRVLRMCNSCGGSGSISRNPADRIVVKQDQLGHPQVQIINPDVNVNKYHAENVNELTERMERVLYLHTTEEAQSGVAKAIDQEKKYQFFSAISNDVFGRLLYHLIQDILAMRNVRVQNGEVTPTPTDFTIVKPSQFQVKTSYDLQEEYKVAKESGLPAYQLSAILADYSDKRFGGNDAFLKKDYYVNALDNLATKNDADIQIMLLNNAVTPRDYQFHVALPMILDSIIRERTPDNFVRMSFEQVQAEVQTRFNAIKPIIPTVRPEEILENRVTE